MPSNETPQWSGRPYSEKVDNWLRTLDEENIAKLDWLLRQDDDTLKFLSNLAKTWVGAGAFGKLLGWILGVPAAAIGAWTVVAQVLDFIGRKAGVK